MILIDANLLIYAYDASSEHHRDAVKWLETTFADREPVGLAWIPILAFLRISTSPRMLARPLTSAEAKALVAEWLGRPTVDLINATERHWSILEELIRLGQVRGPLMMDAHLAALAIEHGAVLHTTDRDFSRFPGLKWVNPLA